MRSTRYERDGGGASGTSSSGTGGAVLDDDVDVRDSRFPLPAILRKNPLMPFFFFSGLYASAAAAAAAVDSRDGSCQVAESRELREKNRGRGGAAIETDRVPSISG